MESNNRTHTYHVPVEGSLNKLGMNNENLFCRLSQGTKNNQIYTVRLQTVNRRIQLLVAQLWVNARTYRVQRYVQTCKRKKGDRVGTISQNGIIQ